MLMPFKLVEKNRIIYIYFRSYFPKARESEIRNLLHIVMNLQR